MKHLLISSSTALSLYILERLPYPLDGLQHYPIWLLASSHTQRLATISMIEREHTYDTFFRTSSSLLCHGANVPPFSILSLSSLLTNWKNSFSFHLLQSEGLRRLLQITSKFSWLLETKDMLLRSLKAYSSSFCILFATRALFVWSRDSSTMS